MATYSYDDGCAAWELPGVSLRNMDRVSEERGSAQKGICPTMNSEVSTPSTKHYPQWTGRLDLPVEMALGNGSAYGETGSQHVFAFKRFT